MEVIPIEIFREILAYLNKIELARIRSVCKSWAVEAKVGPIEAKDLPLICKMMTKIDLRGSKVNASDIEGALADYGHGYKHLIIDGLKLDINKSFESSIRPALSRLSMRDVHIDHWVYAHIFGRFCRSLKSIDMRGCNTYYNAPFSRKLLSSCPLGIDPRNIVAIKRAAISRPCPCLANFVENSRIGELIVDEFSDENTLGRLLAIKKLWYLEVNGLVVKDRGQLLVTMGAILQVMANVDPKDHRECLC
jgi:F-box domain